MMKGGLLPLFQPATIHKIDIHEQNMNVYKKIEETLSRREELSLSNDTVIALNEALAYFASSFVLTDKESKAHPYLSKIDFSV